MRLLKKIVMYDPLAPPHINSCLKVVFYLFCQSVAIPCGGTAPIRTNQNIKPKRARTTQFQKVSFVYTMENQVLEGQNNKNRSTIKT